MSSEPDLSGRRYEADELSRRGIWIFLGALLLGAVVVHLGVWWMYRAMVRTPRDVDVQRSVVASGDVPGYRTLPPLDEGGAKAQRARENEVFEKLGWKIDPNTQQPVIPETVIEAVSKRRGG